MRAIGLDIHRGFCEVAIAEDGVIRPARRIGTAPDEIEAFAARLRSVFARSRVAALVALGLASTTLVAVIGDVRRFPAPGRLVAYLGLDPRVSQSGEDPARHGRISKQGAAIARQVLVEAAWVASRSAGPLRAFAQRIAARRGWNVAIVAVARKLTVIAWHLLSRADEYAYGRPSRLRLKLRALELRTGSQRAKGRSIGLTSTDAERRLERERAEQAEAAYRRLVAERSASGSGAGDATGARISRR